MSGLKVEKVTVEYIDGSTREINASRLSEFILTELECISLDEIDWNNKDSSRFILLEWKDGWKEVVKVASDSENLIRYFVISRPEDSGRLVLQRSNSDYPELVEISRKPKELKRVTVL